MPEATPLDHITPDWLTAFRELRGHIAGLVHPAASLTTRPDPDAYDEKAAYLAGKFQENFAKFEDVDPSVVAAGPRT